ncbi:MAG TPA: hydantoinase B/oxoprolinase family protein [Thermoleophilaceae bacterium]|jgi:N-methylhydantoinase B|nr:hydantoinase B/oxoprolinase family protein [Thermoleophilaceae bacterium]
MAVSELAPEVSSYKVTTQPVNNGIEVDPVTTQLIKHGLDAAAEQMGVALRRAAFSPFIYDTHDYAGALYDRDVRLIAQMRCLPIFVGTLNFVVEAAIRKIGFENFEEGDVVVSTFGYDTGSHQLDVTVVVPTFLDGELVAFAVNKAHHLDVGATSMFVTDSTDHWQEGVIYPSVRLYRAGERNEDLYRTMLANSRLPDAFDGDLHAQIAACHVACGALNRMFRRYGYDTVTAATDALFDHSELAMRRVIGAIPDGVYTVSAAVDNDGVSDDPLPYDVTVEIHGEDIVVDMSEAAPTAVGPINAPLATTVSCVRCAVMALARIEDGANEGYFRPIEIRTRPGTIFDAQHPAPMFMYAWPMITAIDHIHRALAPAIPDVIPAQTGCDVGAMLAWGHKADGTYWGDGANHPGGHGAAPAHGDGGSPLMHISCSGTRTCPTEVIEARTPLMVEKVELGIDSGGAGKYRGGTGLDTHYRAMLDLNVTLPWERVRPKPFGLYGGGDARPNNVVIEYPDGTSRSFLKASAEFVPKGSLIRLETGGGGGIGDPAERDPEAVRRDIEQGYVSEEAARRHHPHAFESSGAE